MFGCKHLWFCFDFIPKVARQMLPLFATIIYRYSLSPIFATHLTLFAPPPDSLLPISHYTLSTSHVCYPPPTIRCLCFSSQTLQLSVLPYPSSQPSPTISLLLLPPFS